MKNYVKAIVSFVFLMAAVAFVPVTSEAALAAPTNLRQTDADSSSVDVSWEAVPGASTYYVMWSKDGVTWDPSTAKSAYNPDKTLYSLTAGMTLYVRVGASSSFLGGAEDIPAGSWSTPIEVVTAPDANLITDINCTGATTTSLAYQWTACPGATSYNLYNRDSKVNIGSTVETSFTWNGLLPNTAYGLQIEPVRISSTGFVARPSSVKALTNVYTMPEKPAAPTTGAFGLGNTYYNINVAYFDANVPSGVDGYEIEVYQMKGNKKVFTAGSWSNSMTVKRNQAYKYRCRYYVNYNGNYNGEKVYSDWSGYRFFCFQTANGTKYSNRIKLSWSKVSNAKNYTVYISTSSAGGWKKVKTLGAKSTGITIRKCGKGKIKKNKKYYVKVVTKLKNGKKTVTSDFNYSAESKN